MPKTQQQTARWDQYVEEARIEPFRLEVSDDETLVIEAPTGVSLMRIMRGLREGDLEAILIGLTGEQWPRLEELMGGVGHKAMPKLTEDLMDHFELYEPVTLIGPGGGKVTRKRPTEIQQLLNQGYRPAGEAPSRT
jgi:hypothetical protein